VSWIVCGGLCCALAVAAGAFGAHGLGSRLDVRSLQLWETAARYLMYGGLGQLLAGLLGRRGGSPGASLSNTAGRARTGAAETSAGSRQAAAAGGALLAGSLLFSGTVAALALGAPRWLGAVTPVGGLLLIAGFLLLGLAGRGLAR
jgi:uncharacterized membrane protein YgdD (TMEM256/DUF423 family)